MSIKIVTHNGPYHSDDIFAVATVSLFLEEGTQVEIIRTRDNKVIAEADFAVDVGGAYNPDLKIFDHHQEGGAGDRTNGVPYASFGLVWKAYGEKISGSKEIAEILDERLIQPIDAEDNGVKISSSLFKGITPYTAQDLFSTFSPTWKEKDIDTDAVFESCVNIAKRVLEREIKTAQDMKEAERIIEKHYEDAIDRRVVILDKYYPWKIVIPKYPEPLFVVYPSLSGDAWHAQGVPKHKDSFRPRLPFPERWAGKMDSELAKVTGVEDATFSHNKRFLSGAKSREGAEKLARKAIDSLSKDF